ncbi:MAG: arabinose-5-phosphate isomerase, partial [Shewanella sp.]|nr:arabinose-5-phosphate isomerase [Shewanella sp.]
MTDANQMRTWGRKVIDIEMQALDNLYQYVDSPEFAEACEMIYRCSGKIIVMGMGKSGHIGNKISATLASTGTPAFFVHPGEASHGDLGVISHNDIVLAIS